MQSFVHEHITPRINHAWHALHPNPNAPASSAPLFTSDTPSFLGHLTRGARVQSLVHRHITPRTKPRVTRPAPEPQRPRLLGTSIY